MKATVSSWGRITPCSTSRLRFAIVTPPAVSVKMPSVEASSSIPSRISRSVHHSIAPPVCRLTCSANMPSAGFPIASERAIVWGFTGCTSSAPSRKAWATGLQPSAWAPLTRYRCSSTAPTAISSLKARWIFVSRAPDAIGTTTWSGSRQPSCSATSNPSDFDPSA
jgi:hypothetical protein